MKDAEKCVELKKMIVTYAVWSEARGLDEACSYVLLATEDNINALNRDVLDKEGWRLEELEELLSTIERLKGRIYVGGSISRVQVQQL